MAIGIILALLGGISLGGITSFAALSYLHGAEPVTLIALRGSVAALVMLLVTLSARSAIRIPSSGLRHIIAIGTFLALMGFGLMGSVAFISPGLAVAILYLYPIMVLAWESLRTRTHPSLRQSAAFGIALIGIITCVGVGGPLHPIGIALAFMAAIGMAGFLITSAASTRAGFGSGVLIWANMLAVLPALLFIMASDNAGSLPHNSIGWMAVLAASLLYAFGVMFSILALRKLAAPNVALIMNIEPITTLLAAHLLVAETLSPLQYSGMIIAVLGIIIGNNIKNQT